jgi:hypothetical protein
MYSRMEIALSTQTEVRRNIDESSLEEWPSYEQFVIWNALLYFFILTVEKRTTMTAKGANEITFDIFLVFLYWSFVYIYESTGSYEN